jgi:hypothetical protein
MDLFDVKSQITGTTIAEDQFKELLRKNDKGWSDSTNIGIRESFFGFRILEWIIYGSMRHSPMTPDDMVDVLAYAIHEYFIYDTDVDVSYS